MPRLRAQLDPDSPGLVIIGGSRTSAGPEIPLEWLIRPRNSLAFDRRFGPLAALRSLAVALRCLVRAPLSAARIDTLGASTNF